MKKLLFAAALVLSSFSVMSLANADGSGSKTQKGQDPTITIIVSGGTVIIHEQENGPD